MTLRGAVGVFPVITVPERRPNFLHLVHISARRVTLNRLMIFLRTDPDVKVKCLQVAGPGENRLRQCIVYHTENDSIGCNAAVEFDGCLVNGNIATHGSDETLIDIKNSFWLEAWCGFACPSSITNTYISGSGPGFRHPVQLRCCTITEGLYVGGGLRSQMTDCIVKAVTSHEEGVQFNFCNVYGKPPTFIDKAKPGEGCFSAPPMFANPQMLDFRLLPNSPCTGKASDGGDIGCRYTPEMAELCRIALELRAKGIITF
jgi:hypothetical protein